MKPIYLDYNATTPADPQVVSAMIPYFTENFGNPANTLNSYGWAAETAVKESAEKVASLIRCKPSELIWNAGATEGNNSVVFGLIHHLRKQDPHQKIHFITSNAEHLSVIKSFLAAKDLEKIDVDFIPVDSTGVVSASVLESYIKSETKLISLMWINNEIGAINPMQEIAELCQKKQIYFHTDATQAVGKVAIDLTQTPIHFLTFSAHKFYGPKGVGCLYIRSINPTIQIEPFIFGGGQQGNRRSGTLNVPAIVGAGKAAELCKNILADEKFKCESLQQKLYSRLQQAIPEMKLNGPDLTNRSPINLSLTFPKPVDLVLPKLAGLAFSQGSACSTAGVTSSHVLKAIGLNLSEAQQTIRLSIGRWTTESDIDKACELIISAFKSN